MSEAAAQYHRIVDALSVGPTLAPDDAATVLGAFKIAEANGILAAISLPIETRKITPYVWVLHQEPKALGLKFGCGFTWHLSIKVLRLRECCGVPWRTFSLQ